VIVALGRRVMLPALHDSQELSTPVLWDEPRHHRVLNEHLMPEEDWLSGLRAAEEAVLTVWCWFATHANGANPKRWP